MLFVLVSKFILIKFSLSHCNILAFSRADEVDLNEQVKKVNYFIPFRHNQK